MPSMSIPRCTTMRSGSRWPPGRPAGSECRSWPATSRSGRAPARRSTSSSRLGRSPSSAVAGTSSPRTCSTWRPTSCATGSSCRTRRCPRTSPRTGSCPQSSSDLPRRPYPCESMPSSPAPERVLQRLDWHVVRRLDGLLQGEYRSLFRGPGVDLAGLRQYQPGDDVRYIDWNVTARTTEPYIRQYHEDREITAWFLLDLSPSVDFGTVGDDRLKRTVLVDFVTTLARILTRRGNRIAAIVDSGESRRTIPVASGRTAVLRLADELLREPMRIQTPATDLAG